MFYNLEIHSTWPLTFTKSMRILLLLDEVCAHAKYEKNPYFPPWNNDVKWPSTSNRTMAFFNLTCIIYMLSLKSIHAPNLRYCVHKISSWTAVTSYDLCPQPRQKFCSWYGVFMVPILTYQVYSGFDIWWSQVILPPPQTLGFFLSIGGIHKPSMRHLADFLVEKWY